MSRPQPALAVMRMRRITNREAAQGTGYTRTWVGLVLNGHRRASPEFRRKLAAFLDLPAVALFRDDEPQDGAA
jgi:transcriptional regulator with XRE-family HTH domain